MGLDYRSVNKGFADAVARLTARLEVPYVAGTAVEVLVAEFDAWARSICRAASARASRRDTRPSSRTRR